MFISTRSNYKSCKSYEVISMGMVPLGGLFVPKDFPIVDYKKLIGKTYQEIAFEIFSLYLDGFDKSVVKSIINKAYGNNFSSKDIVPLKKLDDSLYIMELFKGPTRAFKDIALQALPMLLTESNKLIKSYENTLILVATSGDTGSAALEGFKNVEDTKIICLYPKIGISDIQKRQIITVDADNTYSFSVNGNFDECQTEVKRIFKDKDISREIMDKKYRFSSANSINFGRLMPQIVYYFTSYINLIVNNEISIDEEINVCVPTGNFGNILAAYYAKKMGLPIKKLICASNENDVLVQFINTGKYSKKRDFNVTLSPSMDIIISSNLERYIFEIYNRDGETVEKLFEKLQNEGEFTVSSEIHNYIKKDFYSSYCNDLDTKKTIKKMYDKFNYTIDPHTAVGVKVYNDFIKQENNGLKTILAATASPFKFSETVVSALNNKLLTGKEAYDELVTLSGLEDKLLESLYYKNNLKEDIINIEEVYNKILHKL